MTSIKSKADLKRLPIGQRLTLVKSLFGDCYEPRKIHAIKSNRIVMQLDNGKTSNLYLDQAEVKLEATEDGFLMRYSETGKVCAQYIVS